MLPFPVKYVDCIGLRHIVIVLALWYLFGPGEIEDRLPAAEYHVTRAVESMRIGIWPMDANLYAFLAFCRALVAHARRDDDNAELWYTLSIKAFLRITGHGARSPLRHLSRKSSA
jgi:hypothetical protein